MSDTDKRSFYQKKAANANWFVQELERYIESSLLTLTLKGNEIVGPADIISTRCVPGRRVF